MQPGGCSGLKYQLYFDGCALEGDVTLEFGSVKVIMDKMSEPYLSGASIDFVDTIEKQGFTIDNPNAEGSCACGDSFHQFAQHFYFSFIRGCVVWPVPPFKFFIYSLTIWNLIAESFNGAARDDLLIGNHPLGATAANKTHYPM